MERTLTMTDPPLYSQGFRIRPFTVRDAEAVKAAGEDPDIVRYTFMPAAPTDETTVQWLTRAIEGCITVRLGSPSCPRMPETIVVQVRSGSSSLIILRATPRRSTGCCLKHEDCPGRRRPSGSYRIGGSSRFA